MELNRQILLPKSAFAAADDEDTFITLQLSRTYNDLKTERINNVFNINQQYNIERQASLKFGIYGLLESKFADTGNLIINIKESSGLTFSLPKISTDCITGTSMSIRTFELTLGSNGMSRNLYGTTKSAYSFLFEINQAELDAQDVAVVSSGGTPATRYIEFYCVDSDKNIYFLQNVPYLFYDLDGNRVNFGNQTADVDDSGNIIEIDNDFDFLYDRHWIKQYFNLNAPLNAFFPAPTLNFVENNITETQIVPGLSAGTIQLPISLDQPSLYGIEQATVIVDVDSTQHNPNKHFDFTAQTVSWNVGEQVKNVDVLIYGDEYVGSTQSVSFKMTDFKYCELQPGNSGTTINIIDNNAPSQLRFTSGSTTFKSNVSAVTFSYEFDKPLEVPNQSVTLTYGLRTDAVLGEDFILNANNPRANTLLINFNQGDISGQTTIQIIDNDVYDLDKNIQFIFQNPTQNIALSNVGVDPSVGPVFNATIQDSLITQFTSYIFKNSPVKRLGAFKAFTTPDSDQRYTWSMDADKGFFFSADYTITIKNLGDTVVYNNQLIPKSGVLTAITVSSQLLDDIVIELPSNATYNKPSKWYGKSNYDFTISTDEHFSALVTPTFGSNYQENVTLLGVNFNDEKIAGPSGNILCYFTTQLKNFYLNYNNTAKACTIDNTTNLVDSAYVNSIVFLGYNQANAPNANYLFTPPPASSTITCDFKTGYTEVFCSQQLPFGFDLFPSPPYNFVNGIKIGLRNLYPQSSPPFSGDYNNLRIDSPTDFNKKGFLTWTGASQDVRHAMSFSILNNGEVSVSISGQTVTPQSKYFIRGFDTDLSKLSLILPANEGYDKIKSAFTVANYIVSLDNVSYFINGQASGSSSSYVFQSTNTLPVGPLSAAPSYVVASEYSNVSVPTTVYGTNLNPIINLDCASTTFTSTSPLDIAVRGLLLSNSKTGFKQAFFVSATDDIPLDCINETNVRIPFKRLL